MNKNDVFHNNKDNIDSSDNSLEDLKDPINTSAEDDINSKERVQIKDKFGYDYSRIDSEDFVDDDTIEHDKSLFNVKREKKNINKTSTLNDDSSNIEDISHNDELSHEKVDVEIDVKLTENEPVIESKNIKKTSKHKKNKDIKAPKIKKEINVLDISSPNLEVKMKKNRFNLIAFLKGKFTSKKKVNDSDLSDVNLDNNLSDDVSVEVEHNYDVNTNKESKHVKKPAKNKKLKNKNLSKFEKELKDDNSTKKDIMNLDDTSIGTTNIKKSKKEKDKKKDKKKNKNKNNEKLNDTKKEGKNKKKDKSTLQDFSYLGNIQLTSSYRNEVKTSKFKKSIIGLILGLLLLLFIMFLGYILSIGVSYVSKSMADTTKASNFIFYPLSGDGTISLTDDETNTLDTINVSNSLFYNDNSTGNLYSYDNANKSLYSIKCNESLLKLDKTLLLETTFNEDVNNFYVNDNYACFNLNNKLYFISIKDQSLIREFDINSNLSSLNLDLNNIKNYTLFDSYMFFTCDSYIFKYDFIDDNFEYMDFIKENVSITTYKDNILLLSKFGTNKNKNYLFSINPKNFTVNNYSLLDKNNSFIIDSVKVDDSFLVFESETGTLKNSDLFLFDMNEKNKFKLSNDLDEHIFARSIYGNGYIYSTINTSSNEPIFNIYDIYTKKLTSYSCDGLGFTVLYLSNSN